jgi:hypothetical protein
MFVTTDTARIARGERPGDAELGAVFVWRLLIRLQRLPGRVFLARRKGVPRAERRPVVQAKRSGEQLLASS